MFRHALTVLAVASLLAACDNPEKDRADHFDKGVAFLGSGQPESAILEFKSVLQSDPRHGKARYELARAYLNKADPVSLQEAKYHLALATDHDASNLPAKLELAELQLRFKEPDKALEQAAAVARTEPKNGRAALLEGQALSELGRIDDAKRALGRAVELLPDDAKPLVALGRAQLLAGEHSASRKTMKKALGIDAKFYEAHMALADLNSLEGNAQAAEQSYRLALQHGDKEAAIYLKLAAFYKRNGRLDEAQKVYERYAKALPKSVDPLLALAELHRRRGHSQEAMEALKRAIELDPKSPAAQDQLLATQLQAGAPKALRAELQRLSQERADHPLVTYYQSQLELAGKNYGEAVRLLHALVERQPESGPAHVALGRALLASGDRVGAKEALSKAGAIRQTKVAANAELSRLLLAEGAIPDAVAAGKAAYEADNRSREALAAYANALLRSGDVPGARKLLETAAGYYKTDAVVRQHLGMLASQGGRQDAARKHFEEALELQPGLSDSLRELVKIMLDQGKGGDAIARLDEQIQADPERPVLYELKGQAYERLKQSAKAEQAYKQGMAAAPVASDCYAHLATLHLRNKTEAKAKAEFSALLEKDPKNVGAHVVLGILHHVGGEPGVAQKHYEAALAINPKAGIAANNLANILMQDDTQLDRALELAKGAFELRSHSADVVDTLGWIYYLKQDYPRALSLLSSASLNAKSNPVILLHYAAALAETQGREGEARRIMTRATRMSPGIEKSALGQTLSAKLRM